MKCSPMLKLLCVLMALAAQTARGADRDHFKSVRSTLGVTIGTPAAINLGFTQYFDDRNGVRLSGGYFPGRGERYAKGIQAGALYRWHETRNGSAETTVFAGYSELNNDMCSVKMWRYVGVGLAGRWRFLFGEVGLSYGNGSYSSPQVLVQFGIVSVLARSG